MDGTEANFEAQAETTVFLEFFKDLSDRRQPGKVVYLLGEIQLPCLLAVLAGAESFVDIARLSISSRRSASAISLWRLRPWPIAKAGSSFSARILW